MYAISDKKRLYWLISQYLSSKLDEYDFCKEFHNSFVNEIDVKVFTDVEYDIFDDLRDVSQRFSESEEDFKLWPGFINANELRSKIVETKEKLIQENLFLSA